MTEVVAALIGNEAVASFVFRSLEKIFEPIVGQVKLKKAELLEAFSEYCESTYRKASLVRTLYSKDAPIYIGDVYVSSGFISPGGSPGYPHISESELISKFEKGQRIVIRGNGGSGKTVFLKHLWIKRLMESRGRVPVLVELRRLNDLSSLDVPTFCRSELRGKHITDESIFTNFCKNGHFEFIFDGFDEINRTRRIAVEKQILQMASQYPKCSFLVSGREDDRFSSWDDFHTFTMAPLSLTESRKLIEKVPFDPKSKAKFLKILDNKFYVDYKSFLSNPLLTIMMLMTFRENAIIPSKLSAFYSAAFQTLLTRHDATKDAFVRDRSLSVDDFRRVFSTFCLLSYYENSYDFSEDSLLRYVGRAIKYHQLENPSHDVMHDFCESINLLQKDGLVFVFVHRSFQEFFAAECAMNVVSGKAGEFLKEFLTRTRDSTFLMCLEIHPELTYDTFLKAEFQSFQLNYKDFLDAKVDYCEMLERYCEALDFRTNSDGALLTIGRTYLDGDLSGFPNKNLLDTFKPEVKSKKRIDFLMNVHDAISVHLDAAFESAKIRRTPGVELSVKFSFEKGNLSFTVRNSADKKVEIQKINLLRNEVNLRSALIVDALVSSIREGLLDYDEVFLEIENKRKQKTKSIDAILGM